MHVRCWQCSEEIETTSVEKEIYRNIISYLQKFMCTNSVDDRCEFKIRHEDCRVVSEIIQYFKEKL